MLFPVFQGFRYSLGPLVHHVVVCLGDNVKAEGNQVVADFLGGVEVGIAADSERLTAERRFLVNDGNVSVFDIPGDILIVFCEIIAAIACFG